MAITKKDIEKLSAIFATKEDLMNFATKDYLNNFATKDDLKSLKDLILTIYDDLIKKFDDMKTEKLMLLTQSRRHEESFANHEERIVRLEHKVLV